MLSSFIPFLVSLSLLWFIYQSANEKITTINKQIEHTHELELLDSFHNIMSVLYQTMLSPEIDNYLSYNMDSIAANQNKLEQYFSDIKHKIPYPNPQLIIYGVGTRVLFSTDPIEKQFPKNRPIQAGVTLNSQKDKLLFTLPTYYKFDRELIENIKPSGLMSISVPLSSVMKVHPNLIKIEHISPDLSGTTFQAHFKREEHASLPILRLFYFYTFIFIVFNCIAMIFGIKMLQKKIVLIGFLQSEIQKSLKLAAVGNIAHTLAHDIRQPFSKIFIFMNQIEKCTDLNDLKLLLSELKPGLAASSEYIEHVLHEIMDAGITKINLENDVQIKPLFEKTFLNLNQLFQHKDIQIEYKLNHTYLLNADPIRLLRVFSNIISNALQAMNGNGKIWISSQDKFENEQKYIVITIGNSNSYIDPNDIQNLFEPFYTKEKENGTGLGLAIAQKIIHLHNGTISCSSCKEKGVEFTLTLSAEKTLRVLDKDNPFKNQNSNTVIVKNTIIVIDDDPFVCKSWKRTLKNWNVIYFLSPEIFLNEMDKNVPLLHQTYSIVSDFYFGKNSHIDFLSFARKVRNIYDGPFFLSSDATIEETSEFQKLEIQRIGKDPISSVHLFNQQSSSIQTD